MLFRNTIRHLRKLLLLFLSKLHNMSTEKTLFTALPNEIVYWIFEFLNTSDIMKAFVQLNYRYRDVVRHYVKHIDLIDSWQIYRSELQYICQSVESVKVDRYGLDLFTN